MVYIHAWASHCKFVAKDLAVKNAGFIRCYKDIFIFYDIVSILHTYNICHYSSWVHAWYNGGTATLD